MNSTKAFAFWFGLLALAASAWGDIVTPVAVSVTSEFAAGINMINGSGLIGDGPEESRLHDNDENSMWQTFSASPVGESATFELDANYDLSSAVIWQYNGPDGDGNLRPDREVDEFEVLVSSDLVSTFTSVGTFNLAAAADQSVAPPGGEAAQTLALTGATNVRRVQLVINSLHEVPPIPGVNQADVAGFAEVRFDGTIVPEPATLVIFGLGALTLVGYARRCRLW